MNLARTLLRGLMKRGLKLSVAESYTGGRLQDLLTNVPGSSKVFVGGLIAYDDKLKVKFLGVSPALIRKYGAVSAEVALAMARGACKLFKTEVATSTTGIAGPTGARPDKPRGLSYVAVVAPTKAVVERRFLQGSRIHIKDRGAKQALRLLTRVALPKPLRRRPGSRKT